MTGPRLSAEELEAAQVWEKVFARTKNQQEADLHYDRALAAAQAAGAASRRAQEISSTIGAGKSALQGATFGFSDEIIGGGRALLENRPYSETVGEERGQLKRFSDAHPVGAFATEAAGGLATGGAGIRFGMKMAQRMGAKGALAKVGSSALTGASEGAAYGAGKAQGGLAPRTGGAIAGGVIGGVAGSALPAVVKGGQMARNAFRPIDDIADERMLSMIENAGDTPSAAAARISARMGRDAKPAMLLDEFGSPSVRMARGARAVSPKASDTIDEALRARRHGAEERILDDLLETTGGKRLNPADALETMAAQRAAEAQRMYGPLMERGVWSEKIKDLATRPSFRQAYGYARRLAEEEDGRVSLPPLRALFDESGEQTTALTLKDWHRIKLAMDDIIHVSKQAQPLKAGGKGPTARHLMAETRAKLIAAIDEQVPEYKGARDAFAGHSAMMRAFDEGSKLWSTPISQAQKMVREMGQSERDAFRKGALETVAERVESVGDGQDIARRIARSTLDKKRLRLLFESDESFEKFTGLMRKEVEMHARSAGVGGNSQTVDKVSDVATILGIPINLAEDAAAAVTGRLAPLAITAAKRGIGTYEGVRGRALADALANRLTIKADGPDSDAISFLLRLEGIKARKAARP